MGDQRAQPLVVAGSFCQRLTGFLKKRTENCVLLITPCRSIHTFGMKASLQVAFFDHAGIVLKVAEVPPGRVVRCRKAEGVLERLTPEGGRGASEWYRVGDELKLTY